MYKRQVLASSSLKSDDIVLDSGESTSIFKNASLGTSKPNISDDSVSIGGAVDGGGAIEMSKHHLDLFTTLKIMSQTSCHTHKLRTQHIRVISGPTKMCSECR